MSHRSYRDALLAKADGTDVGEQELRVLRTEEELIRVAMAVPRAFDRSVLAPTSLSGRDYQIAWQAIQRVVESQSGDAPVNEASVLSEMRRVDETRFGGAAGALWMEAIASQPAVDVGYALEVVLPEILARHDLQIWRTRMLDLNARVDDDRDPIGLHQEYITEAYRIGVSSDGGRLAPVVEDLGELKHGGAVPTGLRVIDEPTGGGIGRGELMVIGAGTSQGKSYCVQRIARNVASRGQACLCVQIEDAAELFNCRMLADYSDPPLRPMAIRKHFESKRFPARLAGAAPEQAVEAAESELARDQQRRVYVLEAKKWKVGKICDAIRRHRYVAGIDMAIVDYLQAVQPDMPRNNRTQEIGDIVAALKQCCTECGVALVVLTQYARDEYRDGQEPSINSAKFAGEIENEAEVMLLFWRDEDDRLHAKIPKIKWAQARDLRYLVQTHQVTGCFQEWEEDFSVPIQKKKALN